MIPFWFVLAGVLVVTVGSLATVLIHPYIFFLIPVALVILIVYGIRKKWL